MVKEPKPAERAVAQKELTCGLIMPISAIDGCSAEHWAEVKSIVIEAVESIGEFDFQVSLVSDQDDVGVIQSRIVQKIYDSDIVVCDVSCKNPNVMFELGMRMAFGKSIVIIKDEITDYSFDTSPLEHVNYPRDLRFSKIVSFKDTLAKKVLATYQESIKEGWRSYLSNFATFEVATLNKVEVSSDQALVLGAISDLSAQVSMLLNRQGNAYTPYAPPVVLPTMPRPVITKGYIMQMESAIKRFAIEHPNVSKEARKGNIEFYNFVASQMSPQFKYANFDEFVSAVDSFMVSHNL